MNIEIPRAIGRTARDWDEQNLDVTSSSELVAGASTAGFTGAVAGSASTFTGTWRTMLTDLAARAESRADQMRSTLDGMAEEDRAVAADLEVAGLRIEVR